ncbi:MAG: FAD-dependent oxidoreductase [Dehalococcoidia bacterium]|nr:MAG: FAD-dependent oxidoreductase [Dehalococcoidia bacterium]
MSDEFDWIVAGAGHNGLTAACYLARAGERVLALDRAEVAGGGASTREVTLPGFRHNLHAMRIVQPNFRPVYEELQLHRYGVTLVTSDIATAHVYADGRALVRYCDINRMVAEIGRFSKADARTYGDLYRETMPLRQAAQAARLAWPAPPPGPPPIDPARPITAALQRWYFASMIEVLRELFVDEHVRVALRGSLQTVSYPADLPLTGLNVVLAMMSPHLAPPALIRGGSAMVARALERLLGEHGGAVRTRAWVREILVEGGRAVGVRLDSGETVRARRGVIAGFGHKVLLDCLDPDLLPPDFVEPIRRFRGEEIVLFTVHAAVQGPLHYWAARDNPDVDRSMDVSFGITTLEDLLSQYHDVRTQRLPRVLAGYSDIPSLWDPSYAPPGCHSVAVGSNVSYRLDGTPETWDTVAAEYGEQLLEAWRQFTHLERSAILKTFVYSPLDIVRSNPSFIEASPLQGSPLPDQLGIFRPAYGWAEYATPIAGLYVTGGSAHPMGGLNGIPGHHCATRIARDYGLPRWWAPTPGFDAEPASSPTPRVRRR